METKLKYFIYCRKSSEEADRQLLSLDAQELELKKYAASRNLTIVDVFRESQSGYKVGRPIFNKMIARIIEGDANAILVWRTDRLGRNSQENGMTTQLVADRTIKEIRTPSSEYGHRRSLIGLKVENAMSEEYSLKLSEDVRRGNHYKFNEKRGWPSPAKQGWINDRDKVTKEPILSVDPDRFPLLQKAFRSILDGTYTPMQALDKLNNEWGFRTRQMPRLGNKPLGKTSWYRILTDPFNYGLMVRTLSEDDGPIVTKVMGRHTPMITEDEYWRIQQILGKKGKPHNSKHDFPYKGLLKCGGCDGSVTAEEKWQIICTECKTKFHKGTKTNECPKCRMLIEAMKAPKVLHYVFYHCTKRVNKDCKERSVTIDVLEAQVDELLSKFEISPRFKDWAIKYLNEVTDVETTDRQAISDNLRTALASTEKRLDNLLKLKISPANSDGSILDDNEYGMQRNMLLDEKKGLLKQLEDASNRQDQWLELSEKTFTFACYARYWFKNGDVQTKTKILASVGSNLKLKDKLLLLDQHKPYFLIEKGMEKLEQFTNALEPSYRSKDEANNPQKELEPQISSSWRRGRDSNPR